MNQAGEFIFTRKSVTEAKQSAQSIKRYGVFRITTVPQWLDLLQKAQKYNSDVLQVLSPAVLRAFGMIRNAYSMRKTVSNYDAFLDPSYIPRSADQRQTHIAVQTTHATIVTTQWSMCVAMLSFELLLYEHHEKTAEYQYAIEQEKATKQGAKELLDLLGLVL